MDVGGSSGDRILDIEARLSGIRLEKLIVDVDGEGVAEANRRGIDARRADLTKDRFPFEDGTIDAVFSGWTLDAMPPYSHRHVAEEIHRVLKPRGKFHFTDEKHCGITQRYKEVFEPLGYPLGTFFYGVFEIPAGYEPEGSADSVHPTSDKDPKAILIGGPMYGKGFSFGEIKELAGGLFDIEKAILIHNLTGAIMGSGEEVFRKHANEWAVFLAILTKK